MSDGAILEGTQQYQNGNGQVQFKITLPSGRELESEWLQPDLKKKAMVAWLDAVKAEALNDADAARQEAREQAMKQRRNVELQQTAPTQEPGSTTPEWVSGGLPQVGVIVPAVSAVLSPGAGSGTSPDSFVEAGLSAARSAYDHWNSVALDAAQRLTVARQNIDKWSNIKKALEGNASQSSGNNSGAGGSSPGTGPKRVSRKKRSASTGDRVAKSTDFKEPKSLEGQYDAV